MDFFQVFQERAQQAVSAAKELATTVGADAYQSAKTIADTVSADAKGLAKDARQTVTTQLRGQEASKPVNDAHISEQLLEFVRSLNYASFHDNEEAARASSQSSAPLEQWQVQHATAILQQCQELQDLRFVLCPKRMSEAQFWSTYFRLVSDLLDAATERSSGDETYQLASEGSARPTSKSGMSAWEDVGEEVVHVPTEAAPVDDDLDQYLKGMLDGEDLPAAASGDEAGDDLNEYLNELDDGAGGEGPDFNAEDLDAYLGELDVDDEELPTPSPRTAGA